MAVFIQTDFWVVSVMYSTLSFCVLYIISQYPFDKVSLAADLVPRLQPWHDPKALLALPSLLNAYLQLLAWDPVT